MEGKAFPYLLYVMTIPTMIMLREKAQVISHYYHVCCVFTFYYICTYFSLHTTSALFVYLFFYLVHGIAMVFSEPDKQTKTETTVNVLTNSENL